VGGDPFYVKFGVNLIGSPLRAFQWA